MLFFLFPLIRRELFKWVIIIWPLISRGVLVEHYILFEWGFFDALVKLVNECDSTSRWKFLKHFSHTSLTVLLTYPAFIIVFIYITTLESAKLPLGYSSVKVNTSSFLNVLWYDSISDYSFYIFLYPKLIELVCHIASHNCNDK